MNIREERLTGLGGTDISAIVGRNPFRAPIDVYMEKVGLTDNGEPSLAMEIGIELETLLARKYKERMSSLTSELYFDFTPPMIRAPAVDWMIGHPDRHIYMGEAAIPPVGHHGLEIKTTTFRFADLWGEEFSDDIPEWILIQVQWYMGLDGLPFYDVPVLIDRELKIYRIQKNSELIKTLRLAGHKFWHEHVLAKIPPPTDEAPGWSDYFKAIYPIDSGKTIKVSDMDSEHTDIHNLALAKIHLEEAENFYEREKNNVKKLMGDASRLESVLGYISWKKSKDGAPTPDWEKIARYFAAQTAKGLLPDIYSDNEKKIRESAGSMVKDALKNEDWFLPGRKGSRRFLDANLLKTGGKDAK